MKNKILIFEIKKIRNILELVTTNNDVIWKIFLMMFCGSARVWYHNLSPDFILSFHNFYEKLFSQFSSSTLAKNRTTELFSITQWEEKKYQVISSKIRRENVKREKSTQTYHH